jgi:hypothetical protein
MTAAARRIWDGYMLQMAPLGILRQVDEFALRNLCELEALLQDLQKGLPAVGRQMKRKAKAAGEKTTGSPLMTVASSRSGRQLILTIKQLASQVSHQQLQFGLTPVSAQRLEGGGGMAMPVGQAIMDPVEQALGGETTQ